MVLKEGFIPASQMVPRNQKASDGAAAAVKEASKSSNSVPVFKPDIN